MASVHVINLHHFKYPVVGWTDTIKQSSTVMSEYSRLGVDVFLIANYKDEPGMEMSYYTSGGSGDAGDQYTGLDRFNRPVDVRWHKSGVDKERVKYGFNRASYRFWRQNTVAVSLQDEYYTYDWLAIATVSLLLATVLAAPFAVLLFAVAIADKTRTANNCLNSCAPL